MSTNAQSFELAPLKAPTKERVHKKKWYPMVFVGGIGIRTSPEDLIQAFADQGFDIMIRPSIRTGKSFSYCPNVALRTEEQVQKALALKQLTVGDRVVDIRPHKHASPVLTGQAYIDSNREAYGANRDSAYVPERYSARNINPQRSSFPNIHVEENPPASHQETYGRNPYHSQRESIRREMSRHNASATGSRRTSHRYYADPMEYWEEPGDERFPELTYREQLVLQELIKNREESRTSRREQAKKEVKKLYMQALANRKRKPQNTRNSSKQPSAYPGYASADYVDRHSYRVREGVPATPDVSFTNHSESTQRLALEAEEERLQAQLRKVRMKLDTLEGRQSRRKPAHRLSDPSIDMPSFEGFPKPAPIHSNGDSMTAFESFELEKLGIFRKSFGDYQQIKANDTPAYRYSSPPQSPTFRMSKEDEVQKKLNAEFKKQHLIRKSLRLSQGSQKLLILVKDPGTDAVKEPEDDVDAVQEEFQREEPQFVERSTVESEEVIPSPIESSER